MPNLLKKANDLYDKDKYDEALANYKKALKKQPDDTLEIYERIGDTLCQLHKVIEAIEYYTKAIEIEPSANLWLKKGNARFDAEEYDNARICYKKALKLRPKKSLEILENLGDTLKKLGRYKEAIEYYDQVLVEDSSNNNVSINKWKTLIILAAEHAERNEYDKVIKYYDQAIKIEPSAELWLKKGNARYNNKQYKNAIICYNNALNEEPENRLELLENIGDASLKLCSYEEAIKYYDQVLEEDPEKETALTQKLNALIELAAQYTQDKQYTNAIECYAQAIDIKPSSTLWFSKGNAYFNNKDYENAVSCYNEALKAQSNNRLNILKYKGNALSNLGKYEEAIKAYDEIPATSPHYSEILNSKRESLIKLADNYNDNENYQHAARYYEQAAMLRSDIDLLMKQGKACLKATLYDKAANCFNRVLATRPAHYDAKMMKIKALQEHGELLLKKNSYTQANEIYLELLALDPSSNVYQMRLGDIALHLQAIDKAINYYKQLPAHSILSYKENYAKALLIKADKLYQDQQWLAAQKTYQEVLNITNNNNFTAIIRFNKTSGYLAYIECNFEEAEKYYLAARNSTQFSSKDDVLDQYYELCQLHISARKCIEQKQLTQASEFYKKILKLKDKDAAALGGILEIQGDFSYQNDEIKAAFYSYKKASELIKNSLRLKNKNILVSFILIGDQHYKNKNLSEAKKYYDKTLKLDANNTYIIGRLIPLLQDLAEDCIKHKNYREAMEHIEWILEHAPQQHADAEYLKIKTYLLIADSLVLQSKYKHAIAQYDIALEARPGMRFILEKKAYAVYRLLASANESSFTDATLVSMAQELNKIIEELEAPLSLYESVEFVNDSEFSENGLLSNFEFKDAKELINSYIGNSEISGSQDAFADELEQMLLDNEYTNELSNSQSKFADELEESLLQEQQNIASQKNKRKLQDETAGSSSKKIKKKPMPKPFKPVIPLENLDRIAPRISCSLENPETFLAGYQDMAGSQLGNAIYNFGEENEDDRAKRKTAKKETADQIGLWGERLIYEKLKFDYAKKYNAEPIEDSANNSFTINSSYPAIYPKAPAKAGLQVQLTVTWYNKNSTSCKETINDHDIHISKKTCLAEEERSVEVKTTRSTKPAAAKFSDRELNCMRNYQNRYRIFRVYNAEGKLPDIKKFKDPYRDIFGGEEPEIALASLKLII